MEVAGQWRREWAGTAEYGKVTEGGVTKRVARAMEVIHASAPGTRVRVMRAAFHATAGPGAPASSYMLQSSRRVISSGYDFVEPQSISSKPLEISSLPLEIADTDIDGEKQTYKVTEPDDLDISEPSKWRPGVERNSIRMPSEESSSADNASIIDLDSRTLRRNSIKHQIYKNDGDYIQSVNPKSRVSPLLDAPVTLSTLKYKNLLNGSEQWNNRRKSYSFEDTAPLNKIILEKKDRFAIESSTDSGICKSSEVVNDENTRHVKLREQKLETQEETFTDWLYKNRVKLGSNSPIAVKKNSITPEKNHKSNITLQSSGKVCITLPVTIETESDQERRISQISNEENDRKSKKVEFCKTELHFAADTGTVNIIATDEKPPPTNDFRRRRSAFVPINDRFEKSITLFGEKTEFHEKCRKERPFSTNNIDFDDYDENTAATKSILKNKIPKPKPYLLGENMILGNDDIKIVNECDTNNDDSKASRVSFINAQLKVDNYNSKTLSDYSPKFDSSAVINISHRTTSEGSYQNHSFKNSGKTVEEKGKKISSKYDKLNISKIPVERKLQILEKSPTLGRSNSRQLRESDLMYFGIGNNQINSKQQDYKLHEGNNEQDEIFESVRLVRRVSNSVCSSEIESDEAPEYQNIHVETNNTPVPAPRSRVKYCETRTEANMGNLMSIKEQEIDDNIPMISRRTRSRRQDISSPSSRSISEPPKANSLRIEYKHQGCYQKCKATNSGSIRKKSNTSNKVGKEEIVSHSSTYLYANLKTKVAKPSDEYSNIGKDVKQNPKINKENGYGRAHYKTEQIQKPDDSDKKSVQRADSLNRQDNTYRGSQTRTRTKVQRTEKLVTPELPYSSNVNRRNKKEDILYDTSPKIPKNILRSDDRQTNSRHRYTNRESNESNNVKKAEKKIKTELDRERYNKELEVENRIENNKNTRNNNTNSSKTFPKLQPNFTIASSKQKTKLVESPKKSRRSEYVINYDDKEGTVSSVRKVKPLKFNSDKRHPKNENKENHNEQNVKIKQLNKIALQKISDRYGKLCKERTSEAKTYVQRPCQLL